MQVRTAPARRPSGRRGRRIAAAVLTGVLLSVTAACGSAAGWEGRDAVAAPAPEPPPPVLWPLTGVDSAGADIARPAQAVKVENSVEARPQTGLNAADIVWE